MTYPEHVEGQRYVADRFGVVWLLVPHYDEGMATTADAVSQWSVGINPLTADRGPLVQVWPPTTSPNQPATRWTAERDEHRGENADG